MNPPELSSDPENATQVARLGVVVGLVAEAGVAARIRVSQEDPQASIAISGADSARARALAEDQIRQGVRALLSFGIAGGLAPQARSGSLLLPEAVLLPDGGPIQTDPSWRGTLAEELRSQGLDAEAAPLQGSDDAVSSPEDKRALHRRGGGFAVDMESHAVAAAAQAAGLPFLVLRAVADPPGRSLPGWALAATGEDGKVRLGAALGALSRRPWDLPASIRLGLETRRALTALGRAVRLCPRLGLPL